MIDFGLDGLYAIEAVPTQGGDHFAPRIIFPDVPIRLERVNRHIFHQICKTFVQPEIIPPLHGDEIAEPLVAELVRDDGSDRSL